MISRKPCDLLQASQSVAHTSYSQLHPWVHSNGMQQLHLVKIWYSVNMLHASILECILSGSNIFMYVLLWKNIRSFRGILQTFPGIANIPGFL